LLGDDYVNSEVKSFALSPCAEAGGSAADMSAPSAPLPIPTALGNRAAAVGVDVLRLQRDARGRRLTLGLRWSHSVRDVKITASQRGRRVAVGFVRAARPGTRYQVRLNARRTLRRHSALTLSFQGKLASGQRFSLTKQLKRKS
jgi:hypothetical protein